MRFIPTLRYSNTPQMRRKSFQEHASPKFWIRPYCKSRHVRKDGSVAESSGKWETLRKKTPSPKREKGFSARRYVLVIGITVAIIAVTICIGIRNYREAVWLSTEQFNQQQLILARSAATGIDNYVAGVYDDLQTLSHFPIVQRMQPGILEYMELFYKGTPVQTSSRRLDKNGTLRFIYPQEGWRKDLIGLDYSQDALFQEAKETGQVVISGLIINEIGKRRIRLVKPVYIEDEKEAREFNGVIVCSINPDILVDLYVSPIISGETGYAWLMNEDGIFLAHREEAFVGQEAFSVRQEKNSELSHDAINQIQGQMMAGEEGVSPI